MAPVSRGVSSTVGRRHKGTHSFLRPDHTGYTKEILMDRTSIYTVLLALGLSLSLVPRAQARITYDESPLPRLVATVITLSPRGLATLRTDDGALYQVRKGTGWRV